jgi:hypothetical protein
MLPDRVTEREESTTDEDGETETVTVFDRRPRVPGSSSQIELVWPNYFPPTPQDREVSVKAAVAATGGKAVLSQRTAIENIAPMFNVTNAAEEVRAIDADSQRAMDNMNMGGPDPLEDRDLFGQQSPEDEPTASEPGESPG